VLQAIKVLQDKSEDKSIDNFEENCPSLPPKLPINISPKFEVSY
jgi:hypothetical protein